LASLRIGYGLSHPEVADLLNRVRQPFNVNSMAQAAALAALDDQAFIDSCVTANSAGMEQLAAGFDAIGLDYIPSVGNFIVVDLKTPADVVDEALLNEGVITRPLAPYGMLTHLRITIGTQAENQRVLDALKKVLAL